MSNEEAKESDVTYSFVRTLRIPNLLRIRGRLA